MNKEFKVGDIVVLIEGADYADGFLTSLEKEKHLFEVIGWGHEVINLKSISTNIKARIYEKYIRHATLKEQYLRTGNSVVIDGRGYIVTGNTIVGLKGGFYNESFDDNLIPNDNLTTLIKRKPITKVFSNLSSKFENRIDENNVYSTVLWERENKPKIELTSDEVVILKNIDKKYKYIARDRDKAGSLVVYEKEPEKRDNPPVYIPNFIDKGWRRLYAFYHIFQNITFESGAHLIADLIKENEKWKGLKTMIKYRVFDKRYHKYLPKHTTDNMVLYALNSNDYIIELATGLRDSQGNDIYIGDIVYYERDDEYFTIGYDDKIGAIDISNGDVCYTFEHILSEDLEVGEHKRR